MIKKFILIILAFIVLIFTVGCGKVDITCSIDNSNTATMKIVADIPKTDLSVKEINMIRKELLQLHYHWKDNGWESTLNHDDDKFGLVITMSTICEDTESAFNALVEMMSLPTAPFSSVEGGYSPSFFSDIYTISAELDFRKFLDYAFIESLPPSQQQKISSAIDKFNGTVKFQMLGDSLDHLGDVVGDKVTAALSFDQPTKIFETLEIVNTDNHANYDGILSAIAGLDHEIYVHWIIFGAILLLFVIVIIMIIVIAIRRKKRKKLLSEATAYNKNEN